MDVGMDMGKDLRPEEDYILDSTIILIHTILALRVDGRLGV